MSALYRKLSLRFAAAFALASIALVLVVPQATAETLVSLGDSFSSGEGAGSYDAATDDKDGVKRSHRCHRSANAWPRLLGVSRDHHVACSGAVIQNFDQGQVKQPPDDVGQVARLRELAGGTQFDRVLLTMGGNNIGFAKRLRDCYAAGTAIGPDTHGCLNNMTAIKRDIKKLKPHLIWQYQEIQAAAHAPLLVVGYPNIVPSPNAKVSGCWAGKRDRARAAELIKALDATFASAASAAGASFVSLADVLKGHELCTKDAWVKKIVPVGGGGNERGHPSEMGQLAMAVRVRRWLNEHQAPCTASDNVAAIIDDSGSMADNDPEGIRRRALELLLSKPAAQRRTMGAIEFAGDAGSLFDPGLVADARPQMLSALQALTDDGIGELDSGGTNYNAAFQATAAHQPGATSRIFLTDGEHHGEEYEDGHVGGPATHVIGLNIGPPGEGEDAERLDRIARDTGGRYFPLRLQGDDSAATQVARLQGVINEIDAQLTCAKSDATTPVTLTGPGTPSPTVRGLLTSGEPAVEVVISWGTDDVDVDLATAEVRNRKGKPIADLAGGPGREQLQPNVVEGRTFDIVTLPVPRDGRSLGLSVAAAELPSPTDVTVQIRPTTAVAPPGQSEVGGPQSGGPPAPEQPQPQPTQPPPPPPPPPPVRVSAYNSYGPATAGHAMCRGNPGNGTSMPGGTATQTFTVPAGVASIDHALVQIDPDGSVTGHLAVHVNGVLRAQAATAAAGDTQFNFSPVPVKAGDQVSLSVAFTATFGKIITVYTTSPPAGGGTFTASNSCSAGAPNVATGNGLRAVVSGWSG